MLSAPRQITPIIFGFNFEVFAFLSDSNCSPSSFNLTFCVSGDYKALKKRIISWSTSIHIFYFLYFSRAYHSSYKIFTMSSLSSSSARSSSSDKYLENLKREKIKREGRKIFKQKLTLTREVPWNRCPHRTRCPRDSLRPSRRRNRATIHLAPLPPIPRPNQFRNWSIPGERKRERVFFEIVKRWMTDKRRRRKNWYEVCIIEVTENNLIGMRLKARISLFIEHFFFRRWYKMAAK